MPTVSPGPGARYCSETPCALHLDTNFSDTNELAPGIQHHDAGSNQTLEGCFSSGTQEAAITRYLRLAAPLTIASTRALDEQLGTKPGPGITVSDSTPIAPTEKQRLSVSWP